jgi:hypothetical protein
MEIQSFLMKLKNPMRSNERRIWSQSKRLAIFYHEKNLSQNCYAKNNHRSPLSLGLLGNDAGVALRRAGLLPTSDGTKPGLVAKDYRNGPVPRSVKVDAD